MIAPSSSQGRAPVPGGKSVWLCGGQGSQYFGMGQALYAEEPVFREELRSLDAIAREMLGRSVIDTLFSAHKRLTDPLDELLISHPAILMVEVALARTLRNRGLRPDYVVGASLGELSSLVIAGAVSAQAALRVCITEAELLLSHCERGGMVAILDDVSVFHREAWLHEQVWLAAVNFERHFIVAGPASRCDELEKRCKARGLLHQRLPVQQAFHTPMIDAARSACLRAMEAVPIGQLEVPVFSATQATRISQPSALYLWQQLREPIRFLDALGALEQLMPCTVVDLSPGGTLGTFLKHHLARSHKRIQCFEVMTPFRTDLANLARIEEHHRGLQQG